LRILHVVPTYLPATRYGGPIVSVHGLCRALAARGHDVHVFTTNIDGDGTSAVPLGVAVPLDEVNVHYFASPLPRLYYSPAMRRALKGVDRFDVVHLHSVFLWPTYAAARAARKAGVPYLVSPRGMLVPELIERKSRLAKRVWIRLFEESTLLHSSIVHFTSGREREDARRTGIPIPGAVIIPNGVELSLDRSSERGTDLLFLGRINWKKGLDRLIEAMRLLPEARLTIAGNDE
jgi:glycosyltransferase involved in cell wall biosynthesis